MTTRKYSSTVRALHWITAVIVVGLVLIGIYMAGIPEDASNKATLYPWHKSFGILVFLLTALRLMVRLRSVSPPLPPSLSPLVQRIARSAHFTLYFLLFVLPITGYLSSSTYRLSHGVEFFGLHLPDAMGKSDIAFELFRTAHQALGYLLAAIVAFHIAGALKHRFFGTRDTDVLHRML